MEEWDGNLADQPYTWAGGQGLNPLLNLMCVVISLQGLKGMLAVLKEVDAN